MFVSLPGQRWLQRYCIAATLMAAVAGASATAAPGSGKTPLPVKPRVILVLGDSLSAEYGLQRGTGWVALLDARLRAEKVSALVINASISGDTSAGGRSRLPELLARHRPSHVIIELGGNDALRGLALDATRDNLNQMTQAAQKSGARVLLLGMQVPPNYGRDYSERFAAVFADVARSHRAALVPFLLHGVADGPNAMHFFQADRIHPTQEAHPVILANVWPQLRPLLQ